MIDLSKPYALAPTILLVSAVLHIVVIISSLGGYIVPMITYAILWSVCAYFLTWGNRWIAGLVFFLTTFSFATVPLAYGLSEKGLTSIAFMAITAMDFLAALILFLELWRSPATATSN